MTVLSNGSEEETWECIRCNESVPTGRFRCTGCKAWKDGKRPTKAGSTRQRKAKAKPELEAERKAKLEARVARMNQLEMEVQDPVRIVTYYAV